VPDQFVPIGQTVAKI